MISIALMFGAIAGAVQEAPRQPRPRPAAMVLSLKGKVGFRSGSGTPSVAKLGNLLYAGERLDVPADGAATLAILGEGAQEEIRPGNEVTIGPDGCKPSGAVARRIEQRQALASTMRDLRPAPSDSRKAAAVFRSSRQSNRAITPIFGATVASDRPSLAWPAVEGVKSYLVSLVAQGSERVVWKGETKEAKAEFPGDKAPLRRGNLYSWKVTDQDSRPVAEGEFSVATESDLRQMAEARDAEGGDRADRLAAALTYRRLGAYAEAMGGFERLAADSPDESLYREMLAELRGLAGRPIAANATR